MRPDLLLTQVARIAEDVGRLRGHLPSDPEAFVVARLAAQVELLDSMLRPSAGERYREYRARGWNEQAALEQAFKEVDAETRELRRRLGVRDEWAA